MKSIKRRSFIKNFALGTSASLFVTSIHAKLLTPSEMEGPFYPVKPQKDTDADLTRVKGRTSIAKGELIEVFGHILDQDSKPIENMTIDIWQANTFGKYDHPDDDKPAPLDNDFQGWAIIKSDADGRYKIKTIAPGAYPVGDGTEFRTPHIHFKISKEGYVPLMTMMYFPHHPLNAQDGLINRKTAQETELMTAKMIGRTSTNFTQYQFDIVIEKL